MHFTVMLRVKHNFRVLAYVDGFLVCPSVGASINKTGLREGFASY